MILTGQQPNYLPWIGFFHKVASADALVLVDHVQYEKRGVTNSNAIRGKEGRIELTVPVLSSGRFEQPIKDVEINNTVPWRRKHWKSMTLAYQKAPFFAAYGPYFEALYAKEWTHLAALNEDLIRFLMKSFAIERPVHRSSEWTLDGAKTGLLIALCRSAGATGYLSGNGARKYVDEAEFEKTGLTHRFQEFRHPVYAQPYPEFMTNLSAVDLLFNAGPAAGDLIRASHEEHSK